LIIDPACSIIFEAEKAEAGVMARPPARIDEPFFGGRKILFSCLQGVSVLIIVLAIYGVGLYLGYVENEVRTFAFITLISANIAVILSNRSWTRNIFQILGSPNPTVKWVAGGAVLFLAAVLNVPFLRDVFLFTRVDVLEISICVAAGLLSITGFELYKVGLHVSR
jgi:P-type Ca2+ transporter type 2C